MMLLILLIGESDAHCLKLLSGLVVGGHVFVNFLNL